MRRVLREKCLDAVDEGEDLGLAGGEAMRQVYEKKERLTWTNRRATNGKTLFPMRQPVLRLIAISESDQTDELSDDDLEIKFRDWLLH